MEIRAFDHDAALLDIFAELPFMLRASDPRWIPPNRAAVRRQLSPDSAFSRHGCVRSFLAFDGEAPVGRCTASIDRQLSHKGEPAGAVGFFESQSWEAAAPLLDAARDWLCARGCRSILGPMELSIWNSYRFMTRGFETDSFFGEPRNPPSYPEYFVRYGFRPFARWHSWDLARGHLQKLRAVVEEMVPPTEGIRYRPFNVSRFDDDIRKAHDVFMDGFRENVCFTPLPLDEFRENNLALRAAVIPELTVMAETDRSECVGFGYVYPDVGPLVRGMKGELDSVAVSAAVHGSNTDRVVLYAWVIKKAYRMMGIAETMGRLLTEASLNRGVTVAIGALAKEGPEPYDMFGRPSRDYALFECEP